MLSPFLIVSDCRQTGDNLRLSKQTTGTRDYSWFWQLHLHFGMSVLSHVISESTEFPQIEGKTWRERHSVWCIAFATAALSSASLAKSFISKAFSSIPALTTIPALATIPAFAAPTLSTIPSFATPPFAIVKTFAITPAIATPAIATPSLPIWKSLAVIPLAISPVWCFCRWEHPALSKVWSFAHPIRLPWWLRGSCFRHAHVSSSPCEIWECGGAWSRSPSCKIWEGRGWRTQLRESWLSWTRSTGSTSTRWHAPIHRRHLCHGHWSHGIWHGTWWQSTRLRRERFSPGQRSCGSGIETSGVRESTVNKMLKCSKSVVKSSRTITTHPHLTSWNPSNSTQIRRNKISWPKHWTQIWPHLLPMPADLALASFRVARAPSRLRHREEAYQQLRLDRWEPVLGAEAWVLQFTKFTRFH